MIGLWKQAVFLTFLDIPFALFRIFFLILVSLHDFCNAEKKRPSFFLNNKHFKPLIPYKMDINIGLVGNSFEVFKSYLLLKFKYILAILHSADLWIENTSVWIHLIPNIVNNHFAVSYNFAFTIWLSFDFLLFFILTYTHANGC